MINLFPDQQEAIDGVWNSMASGNKAVLLQLATGAGKTYCASEIVRRAYNKGSTCWFTVPRRQLVDQTHETYQKFNLPHSFIASEYNYDKDQALQINSLETLRRRLDKLTPPKLAVIDETHYGGAGLDAIIGWFKQGGTSIVGLTATPWRLDGKGLGCWYDDMVCGKSIRWLIDNGRLSDYDLYEPSAFDLSRLRKNYTEKELENAVSSQRHIIGDAIKHYKKYAYGKLNVTFCVSKAESRKTAELYRQAGIKAQHVDGDTPKHRLTQIIRAFAMRELEVLCCCDLLTFGFDLAAAANIDVTVESLTDLAPTQSLAKQMQKWGRALRMKEFPAIILDHAGNKDKHGSPCIERDWQLADWKRKQSNKPAERVISVRQCPQCYMPHRAHLSKCPACGYIHKIDGRAIEMKEGELVKAEIKHKKKLERMEVGKCRTMDDLWRIAKERNYKPGWVYYQAKLKNIKQ